MKKQVKMVGVIALIVGVFVTSCSKEEETFQEETAALQFELPQDILDKANQLDIDPTALNYHNFQSSSFNFLDERVIFGGDQSISKEEFLSIDLEGSSSRQYRFDNIIDIDYHPVINVFALVNDNEPEGVPTRYAQAIVDAADEWNSVICSDINVNVFISDNFEDFFNNEDHFDTIIFFNRDFEAALFQAGVPTFDGRPGEYVMVGRFGVTLSVESFKNIMIHEFGHNFGLRHTDWNNPISCGSMVDPEPTAIHIAGTPTISDPQPDSIMNACPSVSELNLNDKIAILELYNSGYPQWCVDVEGL